ncbi:MULTISPECIES: hemin-degrading factor [Photorhabdus]|uniref:hemin-degrading factor n=1 Tax=Photorhabdus TaxID=29487 RepID=UPI000DCC596D|nr:MULTISPECIES: ChuX/HutX family heme-like substrate-binding protein [Photorhabdus]MCT8341478.1 hemin-degrading factor [Photorhabdus kleinii]RAX04253.1 hemin-degrading factor [Photorhabdus sp. S9-53]RAX04586.1 hemin-degrading factor [Photorhabdus sp. S10-54]RAX06204.1 hemin-degrading factor [Photorhabdus sp. S8-52]
MNYSLYERYLQAKSDNKAKYARDLAAYLNVSEGELLHSRVGIDAKRLNVDAPTLLEELAVVGEIKAITRNDFAVHEQIGRYENTHFSSHAGLVLNPRELDLRIFFGHWSSIFYLVEPAKNGVRHSIQFFDHQGDALHKVYATGNTDITAWEALIEKYQAEDNPTLVIKPIEEITYSTLTNELKAQLDKEWRAMTNVHQFFTLLKNHNLSRQQVFNAVQDDLAYKVGNSALNELINAAYNDQNEIMIFVSNHGCVQIFTGKLERLMPHQEENSDQKWINIFNRNFTLHLIESAIAESWVTRKPTEDGFVTSLELFDANGNQIAQLFGQRTEGTPEQTQWREQVAALPKLQSIQEERVA